MDDVVRVRVGEKDCVQSRHALLQLRSASWIAHHPRIDQRHVAGRRRQGKRAVAEIGNPIALGIDHPGLRAAFSGILKNYFVYGAVFPPVPDESSARIAASYVARLPSPSTWPAWRPSLA